MSRTLACLAVSFLLSSSAAAQTRVLDLVPDDAAGALVIKGIDELRKKGDKFIADAKTENIGRPSDLFNLIFNSLGIQGGVDGKLPTGVIVANPKILGLGLNFGNIEKLIVLAVPFNNLDNVSASFGFKPGQLKPKQMSDGKGQVFGTKFYVEDRYLYIANNADAIRAVVKQESFVNQLDADQAKQLGDADALLLINKHIWRELLGLAENMEQQLLDNAKEDEKEIIREAVGSLKHLRHVIISIRVDGGIAGSLLTVFEKGKQLSVEKLLARLRGTGNPSSLAALPQGNILAAQALQGDGAQNSAVAKTLFNTIFQNRQAQSFVNYAQRPNIIAGFAELLHQLKGIRFAIYQNPFGSGLGHLGAVAIIESDDPTSFVANIKDLARFADSDNLDLTPKTGSDNVAAVRKLVADLGSPQYRLREAATVRLGLMGERALPFLEDALSGTKDLELLQRARRLQDQILTVASERRKEVLSDDIFKRIKPRLEFSAKPEKTAGRDIYSAYIRLDNAKDVEPKLQELLGPEWSRVRFAVHGKQVAVLLGSNRELLQTTLQNLEGNKPGLADSKAFAGFARNSNAKRNLEIHIAARALMSLTTPTPLKEREQIASNATPTSLAMTVGADSIQLDLWVPPEEFALFWKVFQ